MTTLSNTWATSINNTPVQSSQTVQGQNVIYALKQAYVAAGYVIQISSNGTTLKTDGTDTWASSADVVFAAAGSPHSYVQVHSPAGMLPSSNQARVLIDCGVTSGNPWLVNLGFASANYTSSGSVNTIPTAPANATAFNNRQFLHASLANSKYHYMYVTSGTQVGNLVFLVSQDGTGRFHFMTGLLATQGAETGDGWPACYFGSFLESSTGALSVTQLTSTTQSGQFHFDGTVIAGSRLINPNSSADGADYMSLQTASGSSITGVYPDFPMVLGDTTTGKLTTRGYIVDLAWAPTGSAGMTGTVEPASGTTTTMIAGGAWLPNGGVAPLL